MADDASTDGTWEWMQEIADKDMNVKIHRNPGPKRSGHTILYDLLINDYATNEIVMIWHADMVATPKMDKEIDKYIKANLSLEKGGEKYEQLYADCLATRRTN